MFLNTTKLPTGSKKTKKIRLRGSRRTFVLSFFCFSFLYAWTPILRLRTRDSFCATIKIHRPSLFKDTPPIPVQRFLPILGVLHDDLLAPLAGGPDEGGDQGLPQHGHGLHRVITSRGQSPVVFFKFGTFCRPFFGSRHCTYWFKAEGWTYFCRFVFVCFT